jgi:cell division transport system permease protein
MIPPLLVSAWTVKGRYLLRETWLGLRRGGWMNGAAISTIAILLFLLGTGLQVSWQMDNLVTQLGDQLEISVYLREGVPPDQLKSRIANMAGVTQVKTIPKEQAWRALLTDMGNSNIEEATALLGANPLADELKIKVNSPADLTTIADQVKQIDGIEEVWFTSGVAEGLRQLRWIMGSVGAALVTVCSGVAIAVITITIQLITVARRREIEVLQLVGATRRWISVPFMLQGIVYGTLGAVCAYTILHICSQSLGSVITQQSELIKSLLMGIFIDWRSTWLLPLILLLFGASVGMVGSWLAIRRIH